MKPQSMWSTSQSRLETKVIRKQVTKFLSVEVIEGRDETLHSEIHKLINLIRKTKRLSSGGRLLLY
jgi:hypothetical protein